MEPVFMILGQTAATAAVFAIEDKLPVQQVAYPKLRDRLLQDGQVLHYDGPKSARGLDPKKIPGVVVDDAQAAQTGEWSEGGAATKFIGDGYAHDGNADKGQKSLLFTAKLPTAGKYEVFFAYTPNANRASNVPVTVIHAAGRHNAVVNEKKPAPPGATGVSLGTFEFGADATVLVSNEATDGFVVADGVQWVPAK
jgi:hypothetical protein